MQRRFSCALRKSASARINGEPRVRHTGRVRSSSICALLLTALFALAGASSYFEDTSARSGIHFVLKNSATAERHQIETMVGGVAVFDFDNDGYPDIYFTNGAQQPALTKSDPSYWNRLYRNRRDGTFEDVTEKAGVRAESFTTGTATGDFDNDGNVDLFVAGVRRSFLFRNRGDGTFEDVTAKSGIQNHGWAIAGGWFDYDNDGRLDLFVVNYVAWDPSTEPFCGESERKYRTYCHPKYYKPLANTLYHNNGDGTFTDVSDASGIAAACRQRDGRRVLRLRRRRPHGRVRHERHHAELPVP